MLSVSFVVLTGGTAEARFMRAACILDLALRYLQQLANSEIDSFRACSKALTGIVRTTKATQDDGSMLAAIGCANTTGAVFSLPRILLLIR